VPCVHLCRYKKCTRYRSEPLLDHWGQKQTWNNNNNNNNNPICKAPECQKTSVALEWLERYSRVVQDTVILTGIC